MRFGFVDFRVQTASDIDADQDLRLAEALAERELHTNFDQLRTYYYSLHPRASAELHDRHEAHFHGEAIRAADTLKKLAGNGPVLELGCGAGQYVRAAVRNGHHATGIDASLCQLILARRLLADEGLAAELVAAHMESLPFPSDVFSVTLAIDVVEHVDDPRSMLAEAARVLAPGGCLWLTTPNRFSLTPEPHVGLWGVGWLPRSLATRYVQARTGIDYSSIRLLSLASLRRRLERPFPGGVTVQLPAFTSEEVQAFQVVKRLFAHAYVTLSKVRWLHGLLLTIGPYFQVTCTKAPVPGE